MFYSQYVLAKKGPLGKIWLAAHMEKKVPKPEIMKTDIPESVKSISEPQVPMALRVSGHLLLGVVRIFSRKVTYLLTDCSEAMLKIKTSFKDAPSDVQMERGTSMKKYDDITNQEEFDPLDLETELPSQANDLAGLSSQNMFGQSMPLMGKDTLAEDRALLLGHDAEMEEEGFKHNANWEVFFEEGGDKAGFEPPPGAKRPRVSDELPPIEKDRSADTPAQDDPMEVPRHGAEPPSGGLPAEFNLPNADDIPTFADPSPGKTLNEVFEEEMGDEFDKARGPRASLLRQEEEPMEEEEEEPAAAAAQGSARKGKRKMIMDTKREDKQLSTEEMREQLADTSSIVRDLSAAPPRAAAGPSICDGSLLSLAHLPHIPPEILELSMALMREVAPAPKKARSRAEQRPAGTPAQDAPIFTPGAPAPPTYDQPEQPPSADGFPSGGDAPTFGPFAGGAPTPGQPTPVGFETSHALPDEEGDASGEKGGTSSQAGSQENDPAAWSLRTQKMYAMLGAAFDESAGEGLSYQAMVSKTGHSGARKRRVVAGCFQELLYLSTHGLVDLAQKKAYADIIITKADAFGATAAKGKKPTPRSGKARAA